jgi:glycosyltransferase involved in cell wall biosynthesis
MRVTLVTPFDLPSIRGNAITVRRIFEGLRARGVSALVVDLEQISEADAGARVDDFAPELIHAFHAYRAGPIACRLAAAKRLPLVVTLTGTDANHDLVDPARTQVVKEVLSSASAIVAFHDSIRRNVLARLPDLAPRFFVIPQSVWLPEGPAFSLAERASLAGGEFIFLLPAGIRAVKRPCYALDPFDKLAPRHPQLRLLYAGPLIDPIEWETLMGALRDRSWARHLGEVPHEEMRSLIQGVDVVLNTSSSEGGMANSVLEAMSLGRPVLAADIEGNRSVIEDGVDGLLFATEEEFIERAERLILDPELRAKLGAVAREKVRQHFPLEREIEGYLDLYRHLS